MPLLLMNASCQDSDDIGLLGESLLALTRHARVVRSAAGVGVDQEVGRDRKGVRGAGSDCYGVNSLE